MRMPKTWTALVIALLAVAGCNPDAPEGPAERAGKKVDKAIEKVGEALEDAGKAIKDSADGEPESDPKPEEQPDRP